MATPHQRDIDDWKIRLLEPGGEITRYHVQAKNEVWGRYIDKVGDTAIDALTKLAEETELDRGELLAAFDL